MASADSSESQPESFEFGSPSDILNVLYHLRDALTEMLSATGVDITKTRATARELDLDRNLVWHVTQVMNSPDILSASRAIPSRAQTVKLCEACQERGASAASARNVIESLDLFERMIEVSLGNREDFETMLASLEQEDVTSRQEPTRKLAFHCNSTIWGVQSKLNFKACFTAPSTTEPDKLEVMQVFGLVGFRRLRPVSWPLSRSHAYSDTGEALELNYDPVRQVDGEGGGASLLTEFCSQPTPVIHRVDTSYGHFHELARGPIGNAGLCTCVFAELVTPRFERYRTSREEFHATMIDLITPSEHTILDLFLHHELGRFDAPEAMLLDRLSAARGYDPEMDAKYQLPMTVSATGLGSSASGTATPEFPLYPNVLSDVLTSMGWKHEDFDGFRLSLKYPPVPSAMVLRVPLSWKAEA